MRCQSADLWRQGEPARLASIIPGQSENRGSTPAGRAFYGGSGALPFDKYGLGPSGSILLDDLEIGKLGRTCFAPAPDCFVILGVGAQSEVIVHIVLFSEHHPFTRQLLFISPLEVALDKRFAEIPDCLEGLPSVEGVLDQAI